MNNNFEIRMIDIKINTNIKDFKEISFSSDMLNIRKEMKKDLTKYPLITNDIIVPYDIISAMTYEDVVLFFFNYKKFEDVIKENTTSNVTEDDDINILNTNFMTLLKCLLTTRFPFSNNIYSSYDFLTSNVGLTLESQAFPKYTYLNLNSNMYTVTQVIWLNDILNHPLYQNLIVELNKYMKWAINEKTNIESYIDDKYETLKKSIEKYTKSSSSRDLIYLQQEASTNDTLSASRKYLYNIAIDNIKFLDSDDYALKTNESYLLNLRNSDIDYVFANYQKSTSRDGILVFKGYRIVFPSDKVENIYSIDKIDFNKSSYQISFHKKSQERREYDMNTYVSNFWGHTDKIVSIPSGCITQQYDQFIIDLKNYEDIYEKIKIIRQDTKSNTEVIYSSNDEEKRLIATKNSFVLYFKIDKLYQKKKSESKYDITFDKISTLENIYNNNRSYFSALTTDFKELMEEGKEVRNIINTYDFLKKYLVCKDNKTGLKCISIDINAKKIDSERLKEFKNINDLFKKYMSSNRKLLNSTLQDTIDNFGKNRLEPNLFPEVISKFHDIYIDKLKNLDILTNQYLTGICEINFGKQNAPRYDAYIHIDLLQGVANKKNIKSIKCSFEDEVFDKKLKKWLYSNDSIWKMPYYPFMMIKTKKTQKKKVGVNKKNETKKNLRNYKKHKIY